MISIALFGAVSPPRPESPWLPSSGHSDVADNSGPPLSPPGYIPIKVATSLPLAAGAAGAVYLVGAATNQATMPTDLWAITGICVRIGSLLFSGLGLFIGYLLPSENVTQTISLALMECSFVGVCSFPSANSLPN